MDSLRTTLEQGNARQLPLARHFSILVECSFTRADTGALPSTWLLSNKKLSAVVVSVLCARNQNRKCRSDLGPLVTWLIVAEVARVYEPPQGPPSSRRSLATTEIKTILKGLSDSLF